MTIRSCAFLLAAALLLVSLPADAQNCSGPPIANFTGFASPSGYQIKWDSLGANVVYEVLQETAQTYCTLPNQFQVIATTSSTQYNGVKTSANTAYGLFVRAQQNPCQQTTFVLVTDTFQNPPTKPVISRIDLGAGTVSVVFSYTDTHVFSMYIQRAPAGSSQFVNLDSLNTCDPNPKTYVDRPSPGSYQYRLLATNDGSVTGLNGVPSDPVTVTVGTPPEILNFTPSSSSTRLGRGVTLAFSTRNATSVSIDNGIGGQKASGVVVVSPTKTTTYTLTASNGGLTKTAKATVVVITDPQVAVSQFPSALVQNVGSGGATTSFALTNAGGASTQIQLTPQGQFFALSPTSFTLAPGASQRVQVTGIAQATTNVFEGAAIAAGVGVPQGLRVPIRLLSTAPPAGTVIAKAVNARVDASGPFGASPTGTVSFRNNGIVPLFGVLVADVPWLIPQSGLVQIPPLTTSSFSFTIDRSKRLDDSAVGSAAGNIKLVYPGGSGSGSKQQVNADNLPNVSIVSVVDTTSTAVTNGAPPPLGAGEIALFVPGVGHVTGSVGVFISDVSILNRITGASINDMKLYYTPVGASTASSKTTTLPPVGGSVSVALADVVSTTFGTETQVGSLQIRSNDTSRLSVSTNIFNKSNPAGTYGTAIPTFRSDRAVGPGGNLILTGLKRDASTHTNLFIQETAGIGTRVTTEFLDIGGNTLGVRSDDVGPFTLLQINGVVPTGGVAAIMTNVGATGSGRFLAYATPVDEASGDNWSVADWSKVHGYAQSDAVVIPVAGSVPGALNTFFRTDLAVTNTSGSAGSALLRYVPRGGGTPVDRTISLGSRQTTILGDVIGTFLGISNTIGYLTLTPNTGTFVATSRTYTTTAGTSATFGTGVPTLALAATLKLGELRAIGALEDAKRDTIIAATPATFRTNFGMLETSGQPVTVRATLHFSFPAGNKLTAIGEATKDYALGANEYLQVNGITKDIIGASRDDLDDLHDVEVDFQVVSGDGSLAVFTSSTDNGTGDSILKTE